MTQREVSDELLRSASECEKGYRCLSCAPDELCQMKFHPYDDGTYFVECVKEQECHYAEVYPDKGVAICNCPVRKELYRRYRV